MIEEETAAYSHSFTPTPWINGTRTTDATGPVYPVSLIGSDLTISFWARTAVSSSTDFGIAVHGADASDEYVEFRNSGGGVFQFVVKKAGETKEVLVVTGPVSTWGLITLVVRRDPETGENAASAYIDGVLNASGPLTNVPPLSRLTTLSIGHKSNTDYANWNFQDVQVLPFAATSAMALAWFGMGVALPEIPRFFVDGDIDTDEPLTLLCEGSVDDISYTQAVTEDGLKNNMRSMRLKILEV